MRVHQMIREYYPQYYSIETYPVGNVARIHKITEEYGIFSNFAHTPIVVEGRTYDTAERLFQVLKMASPEAREEVYTKAGNPKMTAKHIAKVRPSEVRQDWPMIIVDVMKFCLLAKYEQCPEFREKLMNTRDMIIVEDQTTFPKKEADTWGVKLVGEQYVGPNLLGRLLMELRDNGKLEYHLPADLLNYKE